MDELKSCPWCGEVPKVSKYEPLYRPGVKFFYVKCRNRKCPMAHVQTYASRGCDRMVEHEMGGKR